MATSEPARQVDRTLLLESIFIMALSATLYGVTYTFDEVPAILAQGIQPTVFPRAVLVIMFALAALQAFKATRISVEDVAKITALKPIEPVVFITAGLLIAFVFFMPIIGTFPAIVIFLPLLAFIWGERRWLLMALSFAGFLAFVYVLFRLIMAVPLP